MLPRLAQKTGPGNPQKTGPQCRPLRIPDKYAHRTDSPDQKKYHFTRTYRCDWLLKKKSILNLIILLMIVPYCIIFHLKKKAL